MAFTQADIDRITEQIAGGVRRVTIDGKTVEYESVDQMIAVRDRMQRELNTAAGIAPRVMTRRTTFARD